MLTIYKKKAMETAGGQHPLVLVLLIVKLLLIFGPQTKSYISGIKSWNMESIHFFSLGVLIAKTIPYSAKC